MSSPAAQVPTIPLAGQGQIPQLGFGVWQVPDADAPEVVGHALEAGYRHIDTASIYGNEAGVGHAIKASGIPRDDLWVTTKCWNGEQGREQAGRALRASLDRLELDYVDLYLIHWPAPSRDRYVETWAAFIELQQEGLVREIGVSNFQAPHLARIVEETGVTPAVNQVELHPWLQQQGLVREHEDRGIVTEAWSPLAQGAVLQDPVVVSLAEKHGKTPGQVVLRWHLHHGYVVFPKSVTPERIRENFDVFDFHLTDDEVAAIDGLDRGERTGPDPDTFA